MSQTTPSPGRRGDRLHPDPGSAHQHLSDLGDTPHVQHKEGVTVPTYLTGCSADCTRSAWHSQHSRGGATQHTPLLNSPASSLIYLLENVLLLKATDFWFHILRALTFPQCVSLCVLLKRYLGGQVS